MRSLVGTMRSLAFCQASGSVMVNFKNSGVVSSPMSSFAWRPSGWCISGSGRCGTAPFFEPGGVVGHEPGDFIQAETIKVIVGIGPRGQPFPPPAGQGTVPRGIPERDTVGFFVPENERHALMGREFFHNMCLPFLVKVPLSYRPKPAGSSNFVFTTRQK